MSKQVMRHGKWKHCWLPENTDCAVLINVRWIWYAHGADPFRLLLCNNACMRIGPTDSESECDRRITIHLCACNAIRLSSFTQRLNDDWRVHFGAVSNFLLMQSVNIAINYRRLSHLNCKSVRISTVHSYYRSRDDLTLTTHKRCAEVMAHQSHRIREPRSYH